MRIKSVRIENFRSIKDQTVVFDGYTCLVGANGSGKSNVLNALNVFFRDSQAPGLNPNSLTEEDFHGKKTDQPVRITVTFVDLSAEAKVDFGHYVRQDQLIVSAEATFDPNTRSAEVRQFGRRLVMKEFARFFEAEKAGEKVDKLKDIYTAIHGKFPGLAPAGTKAAMSDALRAHEADHSEQCEEIPSQDQFYGASKGSNLLSKHIQWVYVPAVKDASTEQMEAQNTALGKLLKRTVRETTKFDESIAEIRTAAQQSYGQLLTNSQEALKGLSEALRARLVDWSHPDASLRVEWRQDTDRGIRIDEPFAQVVATEGGFEGELTRFGHGFQRSFLLALLQELAGSHAEGGPTLILACEEPELYQHPPQARHLYNVLMKLSSGNCQVAVCTHSPYFVSGEGFESVRVVRKVNGCSQLWQTTYAEVAAAVGRAKGEPPVQNTGELAKIHQALQPGLSELFFAPRLVLTEGLSDVAYITTYLHLMGHWDAFRRSGSHIIPVDGKSELLQPLAIAKSLQIPVLVAFDADGDQPDKNGSKEKHRKDNTAILRMCEIASPESFPPQDLWADSVVMWAHEIEKTVESEIGEEDWKRFRAGADQQYGHTRGLQKNALHIATSLKLAWDAGKKSPSLERLCGKIIQFGTGAS